MFLLYFNTKYFLNFEIEVVCCTVFYKSNKNTWKSFELYHDA